MLHTMDELAGFGVLLVDDHPLFREGLALALRQRVPDLTVYAVASAQDALQLLSQRPGAVDLAMIDYRLRETTGLDFATHLRKLFPDVACALMSGSEDASLPERARAAGFMAYLPKSLEVDHLLEGLRCLAQGETFFRDSVRGPLHPGAGPGTLDLTPRQQEIVRLAANGSSNKEIALALGITPHTVKNHFAQIFEKLGAGNRAQAVSMAYERSHP